MRKVTLPLANAARRVLTLALEMDDAAIASVCRETIQAHLNNRPLAHADAALVWDIYAAFVG